MIPGIAESSTIGYDNLAAQKLLAISERTNSETCSQSLGQLLDLEKADEDELYNALDWLLEKQEKIEKHLALKHLESGTLVLYDVTSTYLEGNGCELGKYGYNRDKKKGKTQIVLALRYPLC